MPINGYESLCEERQKIIVSKDKKHPQKHRALNINEDRVNHYRVDGVIITNQTACDFLLVNEESGIAYLIELKGGEVSDAVSQLKHSAETLKRELEKNTKQFRIVAKKCKTQQIENASTKKLLAEWRRKKCIRICEIELEEKI